MKFASFRRGYYICRCKLHVHMWDISDNSVVFLVFAVHTKVSISANMIIWISIFISLFSQIPFRGILTFVLFFSLYLEFVLFAARDFGVWTNAFRSYFNTFSWNFWKLSLVLSLMDLQHYSEYYKYSKSWIYIYLCTTARLIRPHVCVRSANILITPMLNNE